MAETNDPEEATPSPGTRVAALVRGAGAGTAALTEEVARAGGAAMAEAVRDSTRLWGDALGVAVDGVVAVVRLSTGRRRPRTRRRSPGGRRCLDLLDVRTGAEIDEALATGLAAAAAPAPRNGATPVVARQKAV